MANRRRARRKRQRPTRDASQVTVLARDRKPFSGAPPAGQIVMPSATLDTPRQSITKGLKFDRLGSLLAAMDAGDLTSGLQLLEEMTEKDVHLAGVVSTRERGLTGIDYEITSPAETIEDVSAREQAERVADYVREQLARIDTFNETLEHLASATCTNLAVTELVWERWELVDMLDVPSWRLRMEPYQDPGQVHVITEKEPRGVPATSPKFVVHIPRSPMFFPFKRSALRAQVYLFLIKRYSTADWAIFAELFGMPVRVAKYQPAATNEEKEALIAMMRNLGSAAWAVMSANCQVEMKETTQRGTAPYEALINYCDRKQSILFLGGNLPTDTTGSTGTYAAASVQNDVREDIRDDDIKREARTIRRQIVAPMVAFKFPDYDGPLPAFTRRKPEVVDRQREAALFVNAQQAGLKIPTDYAHERLGIRKPKDDEDVLVPSLDAFGQGMTEGGLPE